MQVELLFFHLQISEKKLLMIIWYVAQPSSLSPIINKTRYIIHIKNKNVGNHLPNSIKRRMATKFRI